ncbi:MAG: PqqD family protein [Thermoanaerobaculia bacterium]
MMPDTRVTVPPGVMFRDLDGEAVVLELESGRYFGLNETGTRMWLLLQEHGSVEAALRALLSEYDVAEELLRKELTSFVETLSSQRLLLVS